MGGHAMKKAIVIAKRQAAAGVDALEGLTTEQLTARAIVVENFTPPNESPNFIDSDQSTGTKGTRPRDVGTIDASQTFEVKLTGSDDPINRTPLYFELLPSVGLRTDEKGKVLTCITANDNPETISSDGKFWQGEQVFGLCLIELFWQDAEYGSAGAGNTTAPTVTPSRATPVDIIMWPDGESETGSRTITAKIYRLISDPPNQDDLPLDGALIRVDPGQATRPTQGWHMKVVGETKYNKLALDMPVGIVHRWERNTEAPEAANLFISVEQGVFGAIPIVQPNPGIPVAIGQFSSASAIVSVVATYGSVVRTDSEQILEVPFDVATAFNVDTTPTLPEVGDEVNFSTDPTNVVGAAQVVAYDAATGKMQVNDLWGQAPIGSTCEIVTGTNTGETSLVVAPGPEFTRTPPLTLHTVVDGRRHFLIDAFGQMTIACNAGESARAQFSFDGASKDPDIIPQPGLNAETETAERFAGGFAEVQGQRLVFRDFSVQTSNNLESEADGNALDGRLGSELSSREPSLSFTVRTAGASAETGGDWEATMRTGGWKIAGFVIGKNRPVCVTLPRLQITGTSKAGTSKLEHSITASCHEIQKDDDVILMFL